MKTPWKHLASLLPSKVGEQPEPLPFVMEWETINTCNAACVTCLDWQESADSKILSTPEAFDIIQQMSAAGLQTLILSGGEPLLRKDLVEIISFAKSKGLAVELLTNGLLMTERLAKKLVDAHLDVISISLDAAAPQLNDELRGFNGYFDLAMAAIDNLKAMRGNATPKIQIRATVSGRNIQELTGLAELVLVKGIDGLHFQIARVVENKNFVVGESLTIVAQHQQSFLAQLDKLQDKYSTVLAGPAEYYETLRSVITNPATRSKYHHTAGFSFIQMDAWGNIFTNPIKTRKLGSIRNESFSSIWIGSTPAEAGITYEIGQETGCFVDTFSTMNNGRNRKKTGRFIKLIRPILNGVKLF